MIEAKSIAYLIRIDINRARESSDSFKKAMEEADHAADVCVSFGGVEKEFTLKQFAELLGFKEP